MTKNELIAQLKKDNPVIREGSDEQGYVELSAEEYYARISEWADNILAKEIEIQVKAKAEVKRQALLDRLGITADEARLLLG
jgi:hypothetical protein